jgi:hypothetical protein
MSIGVIFIVAITLRMADRIPSFKAQAIGLVSAFFPRFAGANRGGELSVGG